MPFSTNVIKLLEEIEPSLRKVLIAILEEIERQREESITRREFLEFARQTEENFQKVWQTIKELAEAQKKTEARVEELAEAQRKSEERLTRVEKAVEELAEAQKRTEARVEELAEAQKKAEGRLTRVEKAVEELAEAQKRTEEEIRKLSIGLRMTREQVGGLSRSVAYALENEAYVKLPGYLKEHYGIEITERFIRTEINDREINLFARARKNGEEVTIVGESVLKLDDREKLKAVMEKVEAVVDEVEGEVIPIIVTHFAKKKVLEAAKKRGIIVVQSFQW